MREYYSIPSREEADRFSEAYLDAQREYHEHLDEMYENGYEDGKNDATKKWISVKDRLPEDRHSVLVYCPHNKCIYTMSGLRRWQACLTESADSRSCSSGAEPCRCGPARLRSSLLP